MNFLTAEELTENLIILLDVSQRGGVGEDVQFPTEEEIYEVLSDNVSQIEVIDEDVNKDDKSFKPLEALGVVWDEAEGQRYWCIGFYIRDIAEDEIQVDHLKCK